MDDRADDAATGAARRVYAGRGTPADATTVLAWAAARYGGRAPPADRDAAFWLLSLAAGAAAVARYRSVEHWARGGVP